MEQWFPAAIVGAESLRERASSNALPAVNFLHVWWARRPLIASRAAVAASLLPSWPTVEEAEADTDASRVLKELSAEFPAGELEYRRWFLEILGIKGDPVLGRARIAAARDTGERLEDGGYGYTRAFLHSPTAEDLARLARLADARAATSTPPIVLDPFAGGGSIPLEAARYGCRVVAGELNPVATAILHGTIQIPGQLGKEFGKVLRYWGSKWAARVSTRLAPFFPKSPDDVSIAAYIWAHTVPCPTTGLPTPLAPDLWLARPKGGRQIALKLTAEPASGSIRREVIEGENAAQWGSKPTYKQGVATSIWTGETFNSDYIKEKAVAGEMQELLLAVSVARGGKSGRQFRAPNDDDLAGVRAAGDELARREADFEIRDLIPNEELPPGNKTDEPRQMGLMRWRQLFTDRQLLTFATSLDELRSTVNEARGELSEEQVRALNLYLGLALDKAVDYSGMLSSWHATRSRIRNVFDRHDFAFKWTFAEFDGASALIPWAVGQVAGAYEGIAELAIRPASMLATEMAASADIHLGSASTLPIEAQSVDVIVTDPPYYDNVMYGECSDYFYVWLKRSLRETWPELSALVLSDKEAEAVANPSLYQQVAGSRPGRRRKPGEKTAADLADEHYESLLTRSFAEAHRVLKDDSDVHAQAGGRMGHAGPSPSEDRVLGEFLLARAHGERTLLAPSEEERCVVNDHAHLPEAGLHAARVLV